MPLARRRPPAPTLCSTISVGGALETVLDHDRIGLAGHFRLDVRDRADAAVGARVLPPGEHVIGERFVVAHHVQEGEDAVAGLVDVDGHGDRLHAHDDAARSHGSHRRYRRSTSDPVASPAAVTATPAGDDVEHEVVAGGEYGQSDRRAQSSAIASLHHAIARTEAASATPIATAKPTCRLGTAASSL